MNVLMLTKSRYHDDVRVRREAEALVEAGHSVTVLALDETDSMSSGVAVIGLGEPMGLRPGLSHRPDPLYRSLRWVFLPEHRNRAMRQFQQRALAAARRLAHHPDVIHAHDFPALEPSTTLAKGVGARLVYDAHEFWSGMARHGRPEPWRRERYRTIEHRLIRGADAVITVSEDAASLLSDQFGVAQVAVVRNTFPPRHDLRAPSEPNGAVYAGRIGPGRDLETVFASRIWQRSGLELHLMGPRDKELPIPDYAEIHESGSMDEVDQLLARTGIALVPLRRGPVNHDVALPNKLFQAVSVGVPVVAADLPQMARVVRHHGIGAVYRPGDPSSFAEALVEVKAKYQPLCRATTDAQRDLDWTLDAAVLRQVYERLG